MKRDKKQNIKHEGCFKNLYENPSLPLERWAQ